MPPLNLPIRVLGRPLKPVALWFTVSSLYLAWINASGNGLIESVGSRYLFAFCWAMSSLLLLWGWVGRSQRAAESGLVAVFACFIFRFFASILENGLSPANEGTWLSLVWAALAGSAFFLEHLDLDLRRVHRKRRP